MADILIRGMDKPGGCADCDFCRIQDINFELLYYCNRIERFIDEEEACNIPSDCPIIELPEHGDLIDRDVLLAEYERDERAADEHGREFSFSFDSGGARCTEWGIVQQKLMDAHAIVPASKEETE